MEFVVRLKGLFALNHFSIRQSLVKTAMNAEKATTNSIPTKFFRTLAEISLSGSSSTCSKRDAACKQHIKQEEHRISAHSVPLVLAPGLCQGLRVRHQE